MIRFLNRLARIPAKCKLYFYYTARPHILNPIHYLRIRNERVSKRVLEVEHTDLYGLLKQVISVSRSTGCEYSDYLELLKCIRNCRPKFVLECGSGVSSVVIAYALRENLEKYNIRGKLVSLEECESFHNQILNIFPAELSEFVDFILSPREEAQFGSYWGAYYKRVPAHEYDFIFIDGPSVRNRSHGPICFNADIINVLRTVSPDHTIDAVIDQRIGTLKILRQLMPLSRIRYDPVRKLAFIDKASTNALCRELIQ